ncbi:MAG TPA: translation initiation factor IF-3 [Opitutaceae bacterium]|jgi:translation initiation factor IF-3|nr:translation initiation factor IF-3 [Opitutaceae bacterium]HRE06891.1 translation initiation factor IF-3 [Opitutaceae bacterium]
MANSFPSSGNRSGYYQRRNNDPFANIRRNARIKVPQIRVISPEGTQLGIMQTDKAISLAQQFNLDLVEVAPNAVPPVCRIMDFGKYVYEEQKKASHVKSTASKLKEIEFSARIAQNDFHTKIRHAEEFLDKGNKVKLRLKFRGREMAHTEIGFKVITDALAELTGMGHPDSEPKLLGKQINVMLTPHPPNKRKRKYTIHPDEEAIDDTGSDSGHDDED